MIKIIPKHTVFGEYITLGGMKRKRVGGHCYITYEVMCTCGKIKWVRVSALKTAKLGCRECNLKANKLKPVTHNSSYRNEYKIWTGIKQRCLNPKNKRFYRYGLLGLTSRWEKSFEKFYEDMGPRPSKNHSIDRINNDKGYSKRNCRWATAKEQIENRSKKKKALTTPVKSNTSSF